MAAPSVARMVELFAELGIEERALRSAENVWTLKKGSATVQIVASPDFVVVTARVADRLPAENREGFFRMLLAANVQLPGAFFPLECNDSVRINQVLPVDWLQAKELAFIPGNVATKADEWDERLRALVAP